MRRAARAASRSSSPRACELLHDVHVDWKDCFAFDDDPQACDLHRSGGRACKHDAKRGCHRAAMLPCSPPAPRNSTCLHQEWREPMAAAAPASSCPLFLSRRDGRPLVIGTVGTSISYGVGVEPPLAWPRVLERKLRRRFGEGAVTVLNGAVRASTADFAALCWDAIWGRAGFRSTAPPHLDLVVIEYTKSSTTWQLEVLLEKLVALRLPLLALLWHHAPCGLPRRLRATCVSPRELSAYRKLFRKYGVPHVTNRCAPEALGGYAFDSGARWLHPSAAGHEVVADEVASWLVERRRCARRSLPLPTPAEGWGTIAAAPRQECRVGAGLEPLARTTDGWTIVDEGTGRPSGFAATASGARLVLRLRLTPHEGRGGGGGTSGGTGGGTGTGGTDGTASPPPQQQWATGFVSLGLEFSWRNSATAVVRCLAPCACADSAIDVHTEREWTITSHTKPMMATLDTGAARRVPAGTDSQGAECLVEVVARNLTKGRLMVTAATLAQPLLRTHSVATGALHWLPDIGG